MPTSSERKGPRNTTYRYGRVLDLATRLGWTVLGTRWCVTYDAPFDEDHATDTELHTLGREWQSVSQAGGWLIPTYTERWSQWANWQMSMVPFFPYPLALPIQFKTDLWGLFNHDLPRRNDCSHLILIDRDGTHGSYRYSRGLIQWPNHR
jgi:hypothetical protein